MIRTDPQIIVRSNQQTPLHKHLHHCPMKWCGRHVMESNEVCQKQFDHTFPCMPHLADWRTRIGMDTLVDVMLDMSEAARFSHEWLDAKVTTREEREAAAGPSDMRDLVEAAKKL